MITHAGSAEHDTKLYFQNNLPKDQFSPIITEILHGSDPLHRTIQHLFSTTKIIYKAIPTWHRYVPGMHDIGGAYTPGTVTIFPFLFHATSPKNTEEVQRLTISKLMQEYAHVLQYSQYGSWGFYKRYIRDAIRCHIEPLRIDSRIATLKHSYMNPHYFEGEAHHVREPVGHLLFIMTYIHLTTGAPFPKLNEKESVENFLNPATHSTLTEQHTTMIGKLFGDYFDEFHGREAKILTKNQIITRSTHLSDYQLAHNRDPTRDPAQPPHPYGIRVSDVLIG